MAAKKTPAKATRAKATKSAAGKRQVPTSAPSEDYSFPYEAALSQVFPRLADIQSEWLSALESLTALDRKTAELVRLACTAARRNRTGVERHARVAAEVGASWDEIVETIMLTQPSFGVLGAVEALPVARQAFDSASAPETD